MVSVDVLSLMIAQVGRELFKHTTGVEAFGERHFLDGSVLVCSHMIVVLRSLIEHQLSRVVLVAAVDMTVQCVPYRLSGWWVGPIVLERTVAIRASPLQLAVGIDIGPSIEGEVLGVVHGRNRRTKSGRQHGFDLIESGCEILIAVDSTRKRFTNSQR